MPFNYNHPVRVAERAAMLDVLSNGRLDLGSGRGATLQEMSAVGVDPDRTYAEVEEALKTHASVRDAVVVGIPDERFGETICGVVEAAEGATIDGAELRAHVAGQLAAYKAPRNVVVVDTIGRAANGKVDYARWKGYALDASGVG